MHSLTPLIVTPTINSGSLYLALRFRPVDPDDWRTLVVGEPRYHSTYWDQFSFVSVILFACRLGVEYGRPLIRSRPYTYASSNISEVSDCEIRKATVRPKKFATVEYFVVFIVEHKHFRHRGRMDWTSDGHNLQPNNYFPRNRQQRVYCTSGPFIFDHVPCILDHNAR